MDRVIEKNTINKRLALITGGSSGLGLAFAKQLIKENYELLLIARDINKLSEASSELEKLGASMMTFPADIRDETALSLVAEYLRKQDKKIDLLIVNAGMVRVNTVEDSSSKELHEVLETNLWGSILTTKIFLPYLGQRSTVLFISSGFGLIGAAGYASYCASKAGMVNFASALRRELLGKAAVYVACPADIDTPQFHEEEKSLPPWMKIAKARGQPISAEEAAKRILKKCRSPRFIIIINFDLYLLLQLLPRLLPTSWYNWLGDRLLPRPRIQKGGRT